MMHILACSYTIVNRGGCKISVKVATKFNFRSAFFPNFPGGHAPRPPRKLVLHTSLTVLSLLHQCAWQNPGSTPGYHVHFIASNCKNKVYFLTKKSVHCNTMQMHGVQVVPCYSQGLDVWSSFSTYILSCILLIMLQLCNYKVFKNCLTVPPIYHNWDYHDACSLIPVKHAWSMLAM